MRRRLYANVSGANRGGCSAAVVMPGMMNATLYRAAMIASPPSPPKRAEPRIPGKPLPLTDEQIVEARRAHEREGATAIELAEHYDVDIKFMQRVLAYEVRVKLVPPRK